MGWGGLNDKRQTKKIGIHFIPFKLCLISSSTFPEILLGLFLFFLNCIYLAYVYVCLHASVEVREEVTEVNSLLPLHKF